MEPPPPPPLPAAFLDGPLPDLPAQVDPFPQEPLLPLPQAAPPAPNDLIVAIEQLIAGQQNLLASQQTMGQHFQLMSQHVDQLAQHQLQLQAMVGPPAVNNQIPPLVPAGEQPLPPLPEPIQQPPPPPIPEPIHNIPIPPMVPPELPIPVQPIPIHAQQPPIAPQEQVDPPQLPQPIPDPPAQLPLPQAPAIAPIHTRAPPKCNLPEPFKGKFDDLDRFVDDVSDILVLNDISFSNDAQRIIWISTFLEGSAKAWWTATKKKHPELRVDLKTFLAAFVDQFSPLDPAQYAREKCRALKQTGSALDYANKFRLLSVHLDDTESAQCDMFRRGLKSEVKDSMAFSGGTPTTLNELERKAINADERIFERAKERRLERPATNSTSQRVYPTPSSTPSNLQPSSDNSSSVPPGTPMQVDATRTGRGKLSAAERDRRIKNHLCNYCGDANHYKAKCPHISRINATITELPEDDSSSSTDSSGKVEPTA